MIGCVKERIEEKLKGLIALRAILRAHAEQDDMTVALFGVDQGGLSSENAGSE